MTCDFEHLGGQPVNWRLCSQAIAQFSTSMAMKLAIYGSYFNFVFGLTPQNMDDVKVICFFGMFVLLFDYLL